MGKKGGGGEGQDRKERKGVITAPTILWKACLETHSTSTETATSNQETVQSLILHAYC